MLQIIVFSFNRAIQLDTLLTSLNNHWKTPDYQVDVIYNSSNDFFQEGYRVLINKLKNNTRVYFHKESNGCKPYRVFEIVREIRNVKRYLQNPRIRHPKTNFRTLLIDVMKKNSAKEVMFMTDDAMFINDVEITNSMIEWLESSPRNRQLSLRLGVGMNEQPECVKVGTDGLIRWHMSDVEHLSNWGYRFSVDAHIYDKHLILDYYKKYIFINPNTLEGYIEDRLFNKGLVDQACSLDKPMLLSFPINMVQKEADNESLGVDCEKLNQMYLDGYTLRYPVPEVIDMFQVYPDYLILEKDGRTSVMKTNDS